MPQRILIIEDEADIANLVKKHLEDNRFEAVTAGTGAAAVETFTAGGIDLVILDLMLPDTEGLTLCRQLREQSSYVPILMLTAKSSELDRVVGLEMGADDYLTKPFSIPELMARVRALFRRVDAFHGKSAEWQNERLSFESLSIDVGRRQVMVDGKMVLLTAREFDLLLFFARHPGRVFDRAQLLDRVWGYNHDGYEHTVNSHINRLRGKIEKDPANPRFVLTVWGVGYKFADRHE